MINYTPQNQLSLSLFKHPFQQESDQENRWGKMAKPMPWDELATIYSQHLQSNTGGQPVNVRTVIAALIIKLKLNRYFVQTIRKCPEAKGLSKGCKKKLSEYLKEETQG
ncbi:MAG: hypothetical protein ACLFM1_07505 [Bacteroidales bacterium]